MIRDDEYKEPTERRKARTRIYNCEISHINIKGENHRVFF